MESETNVGLIPKTNLNSFQAIGLEVWQRLWHLNQASLAKSHLILSYYIWKQNEGRVPSLPAVTEIVGSWGNVEEESVHLLGLEWSRAIIVAGVAIVGSFFAATINFGRRVVRDAYKISFPREGKSAARSKPYGSSLDKLKDLFGVELLDAERILPTVDEVLLLRNKIAHDSSLYQLREASPGVFCSPAKSLPEATVEEAMETLMLVTELTDSIFVELFVHLFGCTPNVRPLTEEIRKAHESIRQGWREAEAKPPTVQRIIDPAWTSIEVGDGHRVATIGDRRFSAWPTGVPTLPALFSVPAHKAHGKKARCRVDDREWLEIDGKDATFLLNDLLEGDEMLVEYFERAGEKPSRFSLSLAGFRQAWYVASEGKHSSSASEVDG